MVNQTNRTITVTALGEAAARELGFYPDPYDGASSIAGLSVEPFTLSPPKEAP